MNKILVRIFDFSQTTVLIGRDVQTMGSMNYFNKLIKLISQIGFQLLKSNTEHLQTKNY